MTKTQAPLTMSFSTSQINAADNIWDEEIATGILILEDGTVITGIGLGALGHAVGEICFNTAMTGYQEILSDPSYAGQIITFTFPHIGNVGVNDEDIEMANIAAGSGVRGCIMACDVSEPSNWRAQQPLDDWLKARQIIALAHVDTRALTKRIRENGFINGIIAHHPEGKFDLEALAHQAADWPGLDGMDLVPMVTTKQRYEWDETPWMLGQGYGQQTNKKWHVVVIDYGIKRATLSLLAGENCKVTVLPATSAADEVLALKPDGILLSNGPGDPAASAKYCVPVIRDLLRARIPIFGICFGHQLLALALGGTTRKMHQGHHGANHPVKDYTTGKVEITSMNHGFSVDAGSLPEHVEETHISLFDRSNCGLQIKGEPVFSVQYHPEASPGPQDSHYLFKRFFDYIEKMHNTAGI